MSLLVELIKTIAEAIEEGRGNQRPRQMRPVEPPPDEEAIDVVPDPEAANDILKTQQRLHGKLTARRAATAEMERAVPRLPSPGERLARLLRQPQTLRDLVALREILDRPVALRRERR